MGGINYIHGMRMNVIKTLQPQFHIRMQQISCDTALVRTMGYIGSVVPFALEACGPRAYVTTEPIYAVALVHVSQLLHTILSEAAFEPVKRQ